MFKFLLKICSKVAGFFNNPCWDCPYDNGMGCWDNEPNCPRRKKKEAENEKEEV
ncbi:MAG: hypothetical protein IJX51_08695 [Clostridia bacterium]|nr:hypothetical protein [Clostridia bacterium]